jgi:hypothetical protein
MFYQALPTADTLRKVIDYGSDNMLLDVLKSGVSPNAAFDGVPALIHAIRTHDFDHFEIVQSLLEFGADPNATDEGGNTALMSAVQRNRPGSVDFLLRHGAMPDLRNHDGLTAIDLAAMPDSPCVQLIEAAIGHSLSDTDARVRPLKPRRSTDTRTSPGAPSHSADAAASKLARSLA